MNKNFVLVIIATMAFFGCKKESAAPVEACKKYTDCSLVDCSDAFKPVCGCNGITYRNSCIALCDSIKKYTEGTCFTNGIVRYTGAIATDGCGYVIDVDNYTFSPDTLLPGFQVDNLRVVLKYTTKDDSLQCGLRNTGSYRKITILEIKK